MSSPATNIGMDGSTAAINPPRKQSKTFIPKIFRRQSLNPDQAVGTSTSTSGTRSDDDAASTISTATTLRPLLSSPARSNGAADQPVQSASREEDKATYSSLMTKARTMSPEEFKAYLRTHKEEVEARYRKQGGGIAGGGDWIDYC